VMGPKSGFEPEITVLSDESDIIQSFTDLRLLLFPSLAIIMSHFYCRMPNKLGPHVSS